MNTTKRTPGTNPPERHDRSPSMGIKVRTGVRAGAAPEGLTTTSGADVKVRTGVHAGGGSNNTFNHNERQT